MNGISDGIYTDTFTAYSEYKVYTFTTPNTTPDGGDDGQLEDPDEKPENDW